MATRSTSTGNTGSNTGSGLPLQTNRKHDARLSTETKVRTGGPAELWLDAA